MLQQTSKDFRIFFLEQFTRQLIMNSGTNYSFTLKKLVKEEEIKKKPELQKASPDIKREKISPFTRKGYLLSIKHRPSFKPLPQTPRLARPTSQRLFGSTRGKPIFKSYQSQQVQSPSRIPPRVLRIPPTRLPQRLRYIKPLPADMKIDLGKLDPLIQDPMVKSIECGGAGENVVVNGTMGRKITNIVLSEVEIQDVLKEVSKEAKIPLQEGIFRVALGNLIVSAIISDVVSSKFEIHKMSYPVSATSTQNPKIIQNKS